MGKMGGWGEKVQTSSYKINKSYVASYSMVTIVNNNALHIWKFQRKSILKVLIIRLVQDGRVEGHALTPSSENTGITTNSWTIIDRKTLELTRKDTPHPKTKERPQWDGRRGAITIKSNPITLGGGVTDKLENTYTTEVQPLEWRFWAPCQASKPGGPATGGGIPRESDFEG